MKKLIFIISFFLFNTAYAQNTDLPRVIVLATGGTIAGQQTSGDRAFYEAGKIPIDDLISVIPSIEKIANISGEQVSSIDSKNMTLDIWKKLAVRCNEIFAQDLADGIVITHGTDTQEETAYFLDLLVKSDRPVVFTGSMRPATAISADGPRNLYDAIIVAADPNSRGKGVLVCFNESIYDAREVMKVSTTKINAFYAPNAGPIGQVYDSKVGFFLMNVREQNLTLPFDIGMDTELPRVDIVYMYADASGGMIDYLVSQKVGGIVIAGVGNGNMNESFAAAVKRATDSGIAVVRASRSPTGRVILENEEEERNLGTVVSDDLSPQKARVLLMLALTQTRDRNEIQNYFYTY